MGWLWRVMLWQSLFTILVMVLKVFCDKTGDWLGNNFLRYYDNLLVFITFWQYISIHTVYGIISYKTSLLGHHSCMQFFYNLICRVNLRQLVVKDVGKLRIKLSQGLLIAFYIFYYLYHEECPEELFGWMPAVEFWFRTTQKWTRYYPAWWLAIHHSALFPAMSPTYALVNSVVDGAIFRPIQLWDREEESLFLP